MIEFAYTFIMDNHIDNYQKLRPLYEDYTDRITSLLTFIVNENKIRYHLIESRTKSVDSFKEKIIRKGGNYSNSLEEITDLVGIRIIVYYGDDVEKIERIFKEEFIIDDENSVDKGKLLKTNEFGYQSVHYVVKLTKNRHNFPEWIKFVDFNAEIQIRTVLQHSWASISHELEYKKEYEIPSVLQRKLFRLAGLIELADEEFKNVRDQHNELVERIFHGKNEDNLEAFAELNSLTLKKYIKESKRIEPIEREAKRAGFRNNTHSCRL